MNLALVLAAGRGSRVGGAKALMIVDGEPLAVAHARARSRDCEAVVVVARADVAAALRTLGVARVVESDEEEALGPAASIRAAVRSGALDEADSVLVTPVDVLPAPTSVVRALFDALSSAHDASRFEHGHPVAVRAETLRRVYQREARPLRDVLSALGDRLRTLPMPREPLPRTLDRVEDVVSLTGAPPRFWSRQ